jgi:peptidoglycan/LPS O-acetylase OafA/YrhL
LLLSWLLHIAVEVPTHRLGQRWARAMTPATRPAAETVALHD